MYRDMNMYCELEQHISLYDEQKLRITRLIDGISIGGDVPPEYPSVRDEYIKSLLLVLGTATHEQFDETIRDISAELTDALVMFDRNDTKMDLNSILTLSSRMGIMKDIIKDIMKPMIIHVKKEPAQLTNEVINSKDSIDPVHMRQDVFSFFNKTLNSTECRSMSEALSLELLEEIDWTSYPQDHLNDIVGKLKAMLDQKNRKLYQGKSILRKIIREINSIIEDKDEVTIRKQKEEQLSLEGEPFAKIIHSLSNDIYVFVDYIKSSHKNLSSVFAFDSFENLQSDSILYQRFCLLYDDFLDAYTTMFADVVKKSVVSSNVVGLSLYPKFEKHQKILDSLYTSQNLLPQNFFYAVKKGYLLGDLYQFLLDVQKDIPQISYDNTKLYSYIDEYQKKR